MEKVSTTMSNKQSKSLMLKNAHYELDECGIARLTMARPGEMNALSTGMFEDLIEILGQIAKNDAVRVVVLTGEGRAFCAGGDLQEMKAGFEDNYGFYKHMELANQFTVALAELPKPVIAAINGAATGAGMNIALAADIAIATDKTKFSEIFGNVGLAPDVGGTYLLPRVVGRAKAKEIIMTYRMVSAQEALDLGIVNQVVPAEELEATVQALAKRIAQGPTFALALGKSIINRSFELDIRTALDMECMAQALAGNTQDHKEGVAAFFEKRKPKFQGR